LGSVFNRRAIQYFITASASENGVIVGTCAINGQTHAYAMVPVASTASLGGRVGTAGERTIRNAGVTISGGGLPSPLTVYTGSFGKYQFDELQTGVEYTVTVNAGKFSFARSTQMITLTSNVTDVNFTADDT
jgi:hypothetical protein